MYKVKVISQKSINHLTADLSAAQAQMEFFTYFGLDFLQLMLYVKFVMQEMWKNASYFLGIFVDDFKEGWTSTLIGL